MHKKGKKKSFSVNLFSFLFPSLCAKVRVCQLGFILSVQSIVSKVLLKFIYSEKATNFCEISTVDLSYVVTVKFTVEISQNFVAFSEYMNYKDKNFRLYGGTCAI